MEHDISKSSALKFVILLGIVSLFADMTYEGARSVNGSYLAILGATGTIVGIVAGLGELIGYGLRLATGLWADKSKQYWAITFFGYFLNLLAVPALALAGNWEIAAALMIAERTGKAIRNPSRDAMLSHASAEMGRGWAFGLHEAMDQTGATIGPLIVSLILFLKGSYQTGFAFLLLPALLALTSLFIARFLYPNPQNLEPAGKTISTKGYTSSYWFYLLGAACVAAAYADFPLIAFHFQKAGTVANVYIPIFYAVAMGIGALAALVFGRLLDRLGNKMLLLAFFLSAFFAPFVFLGGFWFAFIGMVLWGIGMGAQESLLKATVSEVIPMRKRSTAFGLFDTCFGIAWFLGSVLMGILYDKSIPSLVIFSVVLQLVSLPIFIMARKNKTFTIEP